MLPLIAGGYARMVSDHATAVYLLLPVPVSRCSCLDVLLPGTCCGHRLVVVIGDSAASVELLRTLVHAGAAAKNAHIASHRIASRVLPP